MQQAAAAPAARRAAAAAAAARAPPRRAAVRCGVADKPSGAGVDGQGGSSKRAKRAKLGLEPPITNPQELGRYQRLERMEWNHGAPALDDERWDQFKAYADEDDDWLVDADGGGDSEAKVAARERREALKRRLLDVRKRYADARWESLTDAQRESARWDEKGNLVMDDAVLADEYFEDGTPKPDDSVSEGFKAKMRALRGPTSDEVLAREDAKMHIDMPTTERVGGRQVTDAEARAAAALSGVLKSFKGLAPESTRGAGMDGLAEDERGAAAPMVGELLSAVADDADAEEALRQALLELVGQNVESADGDGSATQGVAEDGRPYDASQQAPTPAPGEVVGQGDVAPLTDAAIEEAQSHFKKAQRQEVEEVLPSFGGCEDAEEFAVPPTLEYMALAGEAQMWQRCQVEYLRSPVGEGIAREAAQSILDDFTDEPFLLDEALVRRALFNPFDEEVGYNVLDQYLAPLENFELEAQAQQYAAQDKGKTSANRRGRVVVVPELDEEQEAAYEERLRVLIEDEGMDAGEAAHIVEEEKLVASGIQTESKLGMLEYMDMMPPWDDELDQVVMGLVESIGGEFAAFKHDPGPLFWRRCSKLVTDEVFAKYSRGWDKWDPDPDTGKNYYYSAHECHARFASLLWDKVNIFDPLGETNDYMRLGLPNEEVNWAEELPAMPDYEAPCVLDSPLNGSDFNGKERIPLSELKVGTEIIGQVVCKDLYSGLYIDIGAEYFGWQYVSQDDWRAIEFVDPGFEFQERFSTKLRDRMYMTGPQVSPSVMLSPHDRVRVRVTAIREDVWRFRFPIEIELLDPALPLADTLDSPPLIFHSEMRGDPAQQEPLGTVLREGGRMDKSSPAYRKEFEVLNEHDRQMSTEEARRVVHDPNWAGTVAKMNKEVSDLVDQFKAKGKLVRTQRIPDEVWHRMVNDGDVLGGTLDQDYLDEKKNPEFKDNEWSDERSEQRDYGQLTPTRYNNQDYYSEREHMYMKVRENQEEETEYEEETEEDYVRKLMPSASDKGDGADDDARPAGGKKGKGKGKGDASADEEITSGDSSGVGDGAFDSVESLGMDERELNQRLEEIGMKMQRLYNKMDKARYPGFHSPATIEIEPGNHDLKPETYARFTEEEISEDWVLGNKVYDSIDHPELRGEVPKRGWGGKLPEGWHEAHGEGAGGAGGGSDDDGGGEAGDGTVAASYEVIEEPLDDGAEYKPSE